LPDFVRKLERLVGADHVRTGIGLSPFVVEGRTPEAAVFPGSVEEVQAVVSLAAEAGVPILPWGGGTAMAVGMPVAWSGLVLGLRRLKRILEHEPGDLTVTLQAGVTVSELGVALAEKRQWLSLDPPDVERATLGGVIAADASGPRRHLYGTARDLLIGATIVTAEGAVVRGGGKVVKNVAGYDLPKLFIGSYGTLGVLVELTLKLRPLPDAERFFVASFGAIKDAGAAARALMASDLIPTVLDLLDADASRALGLAGAPSLVVAFDGLSEQVEWQCDELQRLVKGYGARGVGSLPVEVVPRLGTAARDAFEEPASVMRFAVLPSQVPDLAEQGAGAARARGFNSAWAAHAGVGVVTGALAPSEALRDVGAIAAVLGDWRAVARANGGFATLESAPISVKSMVPVWDDLGAAARIMKRIKNQLDPKNLLNPDRIVGAAG
jgi:glycolate dehydrogenase FAD-binding subunit